MSDGLTLDGLVPHLGETIVVTATDGSGAVEGRLDIAEALAAGPGAPRQDPFRFVLTLETGTRAEQGTYELAGAGLVDELVFLVPLGPNAEGRPQLEAIYA